MPVRVLLKRFIPYFYKYKGLLLADLLAASLTTVCELVLPMIVRRITNGALGYADPITASLVLRLGALYIALRVVDAGANYFMQSEGHIMGAKIETDMRTDLFHHLQQLSFRYYSNTKVGQIMGRITSDLFDITEFAHHAPENFLISGIKVIIAFIILSGMNLTLTLLIFAVLPFMLYFTRYFNRLMRQAGKECRHQVGEINAQVEDTLLGIRVVKSFANEPLEEDKFDAGNLEFLRLKKKRYHYFAGFGTSTRLHDGLMYIIVVVAGALFLINGKIGVGDYTAYLLYVSTLLNSI
ncbi:MAG: ABC transporter ATP-binding protein, partial [Clostridia bacterium]|nr:ABC transporter ATP-binding protein [Clostridia bacterium]